MLHQDLSIPKPEKTYQGLNAGHSIVSGVSQESAKGNDGSEVGKIEEDDGWHALHWQGIPERATASITLSRERFVTWSHWDSGVSSSWCHWWAHQTVGLISPGQHLVESEDHKSSLCDLFFVTFNFSSSSSTCFSFASDSPGRSTRDLWKRKRT